MWHFSMQGLPAVDVATNGRGLLPRVFIFTRRSPGEDGFPRSLGEGGLLFSVALSLTLHCCSMAGSSPVHCPALSGLSSPC